MQPELGPSAECPVRARVVEVDAETGRLIVERYVVSHDCGVLVNPMLADAQIVGGVAAIAIIKGLYPAITPADAAGVVVPRGDDTAQTLERSVRDG